MNMKYISFLLVIVLFACNSNDQHSEKVKTLDSLNTALEASLKELMSFDSSVVKTQADTLNAIQATLLNCKLDTLMKSEGKAMARFIQVKTPYDIYYKRKQQFVEDIAFAQEQLLNLSHDLSHGLVEDEKIDRFFSIEAKKAGQLLEGSKIVNAGLNNAIKTYDTAIDSIRTLRERFIFIADSISKQ